ncbi:MAG: dihydroorotase [Pseudomonadota bacterium]
MPARLCIHDALLVGPDAVRPGGVVVGDDGRIEALLADGERAAARTTVDARGKPLFAGFVDGHVHMRDPGFPQKEDFASGTAAAAVGGVTTVLCMPNTMPSVHDLDGLAAAERAAAGHARVDYGFEAAAGRDNSAALEALWAAGVVSFETQFSEADPADLLDDDEVLAAVLAEVARLGAVLGVYTGDQRGTAQRSGALRAAGRGDPMAYVEARPAEFEVAGLERLVRLAQGTAARLLARQVSTADGLELLAGAKSVLDLAIEVTPHHLHLDTGAIARHGRFALMAPPLRTERDVAAVRAALADGLVDVVGSDHAPHAVAEKEIADLWQMPGGTPGLDTIVPAVLDLAARGVIPLERVAQVLGARPAALFGLADRKGALRLGADGDLVLVDLDATRTIGPGDIRSRAGHGPFAGSTLRGWPVLTALRGEVIAADGELCPGEPGGRLQRRQGAAAETQR